MTDREQHQFYEDLVRRLRGAGVVCGITSGLACVHYNIVETTRDCDLLCHSASFQVLLELLGETHVDRCPCRYRGNLSPPLDGRWHHGGWTSHFQWGVGPDAITLDVFGKALRGSVPWEDELAGLYLSPHIVAEMKRTNRDKDWPCVTALGVFLIESGDPRGWLHLFREDTLLEMLKTHRCPEEWVARRPTLRLAQDKDPRLCGALLAERLFWEKLDRRRIHIYERTVRPYLVAVRRAGIAEDATLAKQHASRVHCADAHLPHSPLVEYGLERYINEARHSLTGVVAEAALEWLPDVRENFGYLK